MDLLGGRVRLGNGTTAKAGDATTVAVTRARRRFMRKGFSPVRGMCLHGAVTELPDRRIVFTSERKLS